MSRVPERRYSLEPVRVLLHRPRVTELAQLVGLSYRQTLRWHSENAIPERYCERIAFEMGLDPLLIWPEYEAVN